MPEKETLKRAAADKRAGKSASTQAGEFIREEVHHIREGRHGAASTKQAIAIGLSKARRAGVKLGKPPAGASARTKASAKSASRHMGHKPSAGRARGARKALEHEPHQAASHAALARHAKSVARRRSAVARSRSAKKAARTRKRTA
jgi:hypothetical protein